MTTLPTASGFTRWSWNTVPGGKRVPDWRRRLVLLNGDPVSLRAQVDFDADTRALFGQQEAAMLAHAHQIANLDGIVVVPSRSPTGLEAWAWPGVVQTQIIHTKADLAALTAPSRRALLLVPSEPLDLVPVLAAGAVDFVLLDVPTGRNAWPIHPAWVRHAREACAGAGTPFAFLGWGCYGFHGREFDTFTQWVNKGRSWLEDTGAFCLDTAGRPLDSGADFMRAQDEGAFPVAIGHNLGHQHLGRTLDGEEHLELPTRFGCDPGGGR